MLRELPYSDNSQACTDALLGTGLAKRSGFGDLPARVQAAWLAAEHIAPTPTHQGARGIIDQILDSRGLHRNIVARCAYFGLIPPMVAGSLLVLTTGRQYCERAVAQLPLAILPCPIAMPPLQYYQLWHPRSHPTSSARWLRERTKETAAALQAQHRHAQTP